MGRTRRNYTPDQKAEAVTLADEVGPAEASRRLDIPVRSIAEWRKGSPSTQANAKNTSEARAKAAERVALSWADYRSNEAAAAGAAANRLRRELIARVEGGVEGRDLQAVATAYGIMVDKAEKLSDQATQRIEMWAESELDRDLKKLVAEMEEKIRGE